LRAKRKRISRRAPLRARIPKGARAEALALTARIADLQQARTSLLKAAAAAMGLDVEKDNYRVTEDWQFFDRVVVPLAKQIRRERKKAS
jgi:hypothetical protein